MCVNNLPKVATQWNSGATRDSNSGPGARIPSALTTKPLSHLEESDQVHTIDMLKLLKVANTQRI